MPDRAEQPMAVFSSEAAVGFARLVGLNPVAAPIFPQRLVVDGLLSVWQVPETGNSSSHR
jgi:hypothetical protein